MNNNRKNTSRMVDSKQKKKNNRSKARTTQNREMENYNRKNENRDEQEAIFKEVTINLSNTEYNQNQEEKKKNKKKHKILKKVLLLILIVVLVLAGLFVNNWRKNGFTLGGFVATLMGHNPDTLANLPRINMLVIGQSQNLTDTLLVCSYDPKIQDVSMLSIPRDTFVGSNKNRATGMDKINALYQVDPNKLLKAVNNLTDLDIKYYVKVDTKGLRDLVDSVGGIYFDVPMDMDYDDETQDLHIHVKAGYQLLDGDKAEQVVRFRHNNDGSSYPIEYGDQDLGRMKTQRAFITEVIKQLAKVENVTKADDYIKIAKEHVETNFNLGSLKDYAPYAIDFKTENIKSAELPGTPIQYNGLWFYAPNIKETDALVKEMFKTGVSKEQEKNSQIKVSILNGSGDKEKLEKMRNLLKECGYTIISTGDTTKTTSTASINRTDKESVVANELKDVIGLGIVQNMSDNDKDNKADFTVIIGSDY